MKLNREYKRIYAILLAEVLFAALLSGCTAGEPENTSQATVPSGASESVSESAADSAAESGSAIPVDDGRARPSSCGRLQVREGKLCDQNGEPVMLRGVSLNGLITSESFLNDQLFRELAEEDGVNLFRLPMYTYGMGTVGYCTKGDKERHKEDIEKGVGLAEAHDMYVIIDWHILSDGDPNTYAEESKLFFAEMAIRQRTTPRPVCGCWRL